MNAPSHDEVLKQGLLESQVIAVAGPAAGAGRAAAQACGALGAHIEQLGGDGHRVDLLDEPAVEEAVAAIAAAESRLDTVLVDAAGLFAAVEDGSEALRAAVDPSWVVARAAANRAMIAAPAGGKIVVISPSPGAGDFAEPTRAALENMARVLSIEWARHQIRVTVIALGEATPGAAVSSLAAYLASPAGDYFSGCVFSLR